jgi:hypothetical protein
MAEIGQGHNSAVVIPMERATAPAKQEYTEAIHHWCQSRNAADALSKEEIGAMDGFARIDAQRKALIIGLAHYYRQHERSDVAPGVAVVLTLLSDNDKGSASISQRTLSKLFNRSVSSIADAQKRLKEDGLIVMGRGRYAATYPVIPRTVTKSYNHMTWLVEAICTADKPLNLPAPPDDCQSTGQTYGLNQSTDGTGGLEKVNQPVEGNSINRPDPIQLHYRNSTIVDRAAKVVATGLATALGALPVAAQTYEPPGILQPDKPAGEKLADKLFDAAGVAMNRTKPMLEFMEVPRRWIEAGCDLDLDILPIVRSLASRKPPNSISSWKFFEQAVADAKAARMAPMPEGRAPPGPRSEAREWHEKQDAARTFILRRETVDG